MVEYNESEFPPRIGANIVTTSTPPASAPLGREAPHIIADSKNDNHDITDLLLKVALNTHTLAIIIHMWDSLIHFSIYRWYLVTGSITLKKYNKFKVKL